MAVIKTKTIKTITLAVCLVAVCAGGAFAQAPFTIRQPADGSTTREKVKVEIPRASIKPGGFVTIYIDDKFHVALNPSEDTTKQFFTYFWDTKGEEVPDGEHTIRAVLYERASQSADAVNEMATSEVKVNIANKIKDVTSLKLRYKFHEGENLNYRRDSRAYVVGAESAAGKATGDIDLSAVKSKLVFGVDDVRPDDDTALVRNKLTYLSLLNDQREVTLSTEELSGSLYEELSQRGEIKYMEGNPTTFAKFASYNLAVENTFDLPVLPLTQVTVGQTWTTPGQSLELPGLPSFVQQRVKMENKFEGVEWENNYKTAKIRQSYKGQPMKTVTFGAIVVTQPTITIDKVYYVAYKSGRLIKTTRTLTIQGRTSSPLPSGMDNLGSAGGPAGGPAGGNGYGGGPSGVANGAGIPGGGPGGPPPGGGGRGGRRGGGGYGGGRGQGGFQGTGNGGYNNAASSTDRPITIKTLTETELLEPAQS